MNEQLKKSIALSFNEMADQLLNQDTKKKVTIAITGLGSELGEKNIISACVANFSSSVDIQYIGSKNDSEIPTILASTEEEAHTIMENLLRNKEVDAAISMHYPFPIGTATVGRIKAPGSGKDLFVASTTGSASPDKTKALIYNTLYGIAAAKACHISNPSVGFLNVEGIRPVVQIMNQLKQRGFPIHFAESKRTDGGSILRGNDILSGSCDVAVMDSLTGNIIMKMLSSYTTGGKEEVTGFGYGPGMSLNMQSPVFIISRASGFQVVNGAIAYAKDSIENNVQKLVALEFKRAKAAGLDECLASFQKKENTVKSTAPKAEIVTAQISGIDILDLENAQQLLWSLNIYAESGMGCTGPILLVSEQNENRAKELLSEKRFIE